MSNTSKYNVVTSGKLVNGFDLIDVEAAFAKLFKIPLEKAAKVVGHQRTLKKDLPLESAQNYIKKLKAIGLDAELVDSESATIINLAAEPPTQETKKEANSLALEQIDSPTQAKPELQLEPTEEEILQQQNVSSVAQKLIVCPKCGHEQVMAEQCESCGVYLHKVLALEEPAPEGPKLSFRGGRVHEVNETETEDTDEFESAIKLPSIVAAVIAAVAGAFLWKAIALGLNYEIGYVAWGIGGLIGAASAIAGSRGNQAGIMCGVLAAAAILGGKYLVTDAFFSDMDLLTKTLDETFQSEEFGTSMQEMMKYAYEEEIKIAEYYRDNVVDEGEEALREFMTEYGYSDTYEPDDVTRREIREFNDSSKPMLLKLASDQLTFEEWQKETMQLGLEETDVSKLDIVIESLGPIDILFFILGVGTAYRLGTGEDFAKV